MLNRRTCLVTVATLLVVAGLFSRCSLADAPPASQPAASGSVDDLVDAAPVISLSQKGLHNFHVAGSSQYFRFQFKVYWQEPNHLAVVMSDLHGRPCFIVIDDVVLLADAAKGRIVYGKAPSVSFFAKNAGDKGLLTGGFLEKGVSSDVVDIDLRSLIRGVGDFKRSRSKDGTITLTGRSPKGSVLVAEIDLTKRSPYRSFEIVHPGGDGSIIRFDVLEVNEENPPKPPHMPEKSELQRLAPVVDYAEWQAGPEMEDTPVRTAQYVACIDDPSLRGQWEERYGPVDWHQAKGDTAKFLDSVKRIVDK